MIATNKNAAPMTGIIGNSDVGKLGCIATTKYPLSPDRATDFAAMTVARRYGLNPCMALLVCFLAEIGGRVA